jgi:hypothetical protein
MMPGQGITIKRQKLTLYIPCLKIVSYGFLTANLKLSLTGYASAS